MDPYLWAKYLPCADCRPAIFLPELWKWSIPQGGERCTSRIGCSGKRTLLLEEKLPNCLFFVHRSWQAGSVSDRRGCAEARLRSLALSARLLSVPRSLQVLIAQRHPGNLR